VLSGIGNDDTSSSLLAHLSCAMSNAIQSHLHHLITCFHCLLIIFDVTDRFTQFSNDESRSEAGSIRDGDTPVASLLAPGITDSSRVVGSQAGEGYQPSLCLRDIHFCSQSSSSE
jgi:hypothetical protein